jgi:PTS system nitrogen regulatory IIA component
MENETMDLDQLASYLRRDARELHKLASRGYLPGQKVGGQWRFATAEIQYWLETQIPEYTEAELSALETGAARGADDRAMLVTPLLAETTIAVPLHAGTRASVLKELVTLAEASWQVYDPDAMLAAIRQREDMGSTALDCGVALPHPHRPLPDTVQGDALIALGRTTRGIPFGAPAGGLSDLFFLVCCRDQRTHLRVLARISRLLLRPDFAESLRAAETKQDALQIVEAAERDLIQE